MYQNYYDHDLFHRFVNPKANDDFYMLVFGHEKCKITKTYKVGPKHKNHFVIHYVVSGKGTFLLNGKMNSVSENDIFFFPPDTEYMYFTDQDDPWEYIWIEFGGLKAKFVCDEALITIEKPIYHVENPEVLNTLKKMFCIPDKMFSLELHTLSYLYSFFSLIIDERTSRTIEESPYKYKLIHQVQEYIALNYSDNNLSLTGISNLLHINESYLSKIFYDITGTPFRKYLISFRMQKARELLESKKHLIKEICFMVGYSDPHYFTSEFKKYFTFSPTKYFPQIADEPEKSK